MMGYYYYLFGLVHLEAVSINRALDQTEETIR